MSGRTRSSRLAAVALALALPGAASAQDASSELRVTVEQKEALVRKLLEDSPAAKRIGASNDVQARSFLAAATEQYRSALASLQAGDLAAANRLLSDAIWSASRSRQLVPDPISRVIVDRVEFARLEVGVEALRASYVRHLSRAQGAARGIEQDPAARDAELERVNALIEDARTLVTADQSVQAIRVMQLAERGLVNGLSRLLGSATLIYDQKFDSLHEEFAFELDRNRSYEELIPVAMTEMRPSSNDVIRSVGRHLERNQRLRAQAREQASRKDFRSALRTLRSGTEQLQRALAEAGVVVPTELPSESAGSSVPPVSK